MYKTRSESLFEKWLDANGLSWRPIPTGPDASPDYKVDVAGGVIFELKQIETAETWDPAAVHGGEVGGLIRTRITSSKRQVQGAAKSGKPTVLMIFNAYDPMQRTHTEDHDFIHAMYGAYTLKIGVQSRAITGRYLGDGKSFQAAKNTSFSALARLRESGRTADFDVTIFENIHAAVLIDYDALPPCFEVVRIERPEPTVPSGDPASPR